MSDPIGQTLVEQAIDLLNQESRRLYGEPLGDEQIAACFDEGQAFGMLEDMEARMGFRIRDAWMLLARHYYEDMTLVGAVQWGQEEARMALAAYDGDLADGFTLAEAREALRKRLDRAACYLDVPAAWRAYRDALLAEVPDIDGEVEA